MNKGAKFSECGNYRYSLWRIWDEDKKVLTFIGLNPSTANEEKDDPTIRRIIQFAKDNGYGGCRMLNLFTLISSDPYRLLVSRNTFKNADYWLTVLGTHPVVFAWGSFKEAKFRAKEVIKMFPEALCLGKNKDGSPKHPLYLKANTPLSQYSIPITQY